MTIPNLAQYLEAVAHACPGITPGKCNRGFWRAHVKALPELQLAAATAQERVPYLPDERVVDEAVRALQEGRPHWCKGCADDIQSTVASLPGLGGVLQRMPGGKLAPGSRVEVRVKAVAPPSPSPAWDAYDQIARWLAEWVAVVGEATGVPYPFLYDGQGRLQFYSQSWANYLAGHWSVLMADDDALRFGREARDLHRHGEVAAGVDRLEHHLPMPCMGCDRKALFRKDGAEQVVCRACKQSWKWNDYERLGVAFREALKATGS